MFYCEPCRVIKDWPDSISRSYGMCEICGSHRECHNRASSTLPIPRSFPKLKLRIPEEPIPVRQKDRIDAFLELFTEEEKAQWTGKGNSAPDWVVMGVTWLLGQDPGRQELFKRLEDS